MRLSLLCILALLSFRANACFIIFLSDGRQVLVGNHEDWFAKDAAIKVNAPAAGKYGSVIFTFMSEGWAQGGMNEHGLFFDAAYTPFQQVDFDSHVKEFQGYIWQQVLDKAANVAEAFQILGQYKLDQLSESNIILADADGNVGWIGVKDGKVFMEDGRNAQLIQTNFNPKHPELAEEPTCWRFDRATKHLQSQSDVSVENVKSILQETHQDSLTVYSNIYDLKNRIIHTFSKRNFKNDIVVRMPDIFKAGDCMLSLDSIATGVYSWERCTNRGTSPKRRVKGKVTDRETGLPVPFVNIGFIEKNVGTLSDPDGSFELDFPGSLSELPVVFSAIGYGRQFIKPVDLQNGIVRLTPESNLLKPVTVKGRKLSIARLGWMGGRDGILPFDTIQGGGAVALLVESPRAPVYADKLQVRLMYNSKDTLKFRFHIYAYDSVRESPGEELLNKEIMLKETKRFGWLRFDISKQDIRIDVKRFFIAFEWIDDRHTRETMLKGLRAWEGWKMEEFNNHNEKVERIVSKDSDGMERVQYKYHGNMMNWPGFKDLPPFSGLMIETGKKEETKKLRTFERKTSFGEWKEVSSTLNAVITVQF